MAPSFENLQDEDSYDEEEEIDFSGLCEPMRLESAILTKSLQI